MAKARYQPSLSDYVDMVRRRFWVMVAIFAVVAGSCLAVVVTLDPIYQSTGVILVESQQIPAELVPTTVTSFADERIQVIRQRVMTRENLLRIIERYDLFSGRSRAPSVTDQIALTRDRVSVNVISSGGSGRNRNAIAFSVSFEDESPARAHRVANELVTLFLQENVRVRTERATETTEFLAREAEKLMVELEALEARVADYKQQHANALPEHLNLRLGMLQRTEANLQGVEQALRAAIEQRRYYELELSGARMQGMNGHEGESRAAKLARLQDQYQELASRYTVQHPDRRALRQRIAALEDGENVEDEIAQEGDDLAHSLHAAQIEARLEANERRIESLREQRRELEQRISELEERVVQTPQVERALFTLMRDHENARAKYEEIRAKQVDAQIAESLEEQSRAERFTLLEPPILPEAPVKPDRVRLAILSMFLAAGSAGGFGFLLELINRRVRGPRALAVIVRQQPLALLPYIETTEEKRRRYTVLIAIGAAAILLLGAAAVCVHFFYTPLDMLYYRLISRFG